jgi:acyl-CoA synthetase (AMP-forming)/AMP-acid ligase II
VPVGEAGEIWVRSEQVMGGYWGRPEATGAAITSDGWLRSGDGGHIDAEGYVYVTDRIKDMIISGGENIYPAEIERVLAEHPSVGDVAVIGVPDDRWGEVPKAVVVAAPGATVDEAELIAHARENLAGFKVPRVGRRARRAAAQPDRQDPQEGPAQALLGGQGPAGGVARPAADRF